MYKDHSVEDCIKLSKILIRLFILKKQGFIAMDYDFDYLKKLYKTEPDEFEKVTATMFAEVIKSFPEDQQEMFTAKQWRLKQELDKVKDPLERMNRMVAMFWVQVAEFTNATQSFGVTKEELTVKHTKKCTVTDINKKD